MTVLPIVSRAVVHQQPHAKGAHRRQPSTSSAAPGRFQASRDNPSIASTRTAVPPIPAHPPGSVTADPPTNRVTRPVKPSTTARALHRSASLSTRANNERPEALDLRPGRW